ncbi:hypothetical protein IscW_ISCW010082 [Ixodes scapularis]|uniref:Uncharacterized protein n=1 Tax=Ixodes scapularis TaxID=6945 RepID=B7PZR5_IXOSC|nr:hypothetical protein IscW_ISCW010082 [Ixodes scapularis]|eukprot:XP_002405926.1 hypothetical protein IscW_ISCW010082 [Ixodes scapularis]
MFVIAWDCGLDSVDDRAVQLVMTAVKHQVKEVLTAVLSRRNAYKLREGRFQFALGCTPANPYLRNSRILSNLQCHSHPTTVSSTGEHLPEMVPTLDWAESKADLLDVHATAAETVSFTGVLISSVLSVSSQD